MLGIFTSFFHRLVRIVSKRSGHWWNFHLELIFRVPTNKHRKSPFCQSHLVSKPHELRHLTSSITVIKENPLSSQVTVILQNRSSFWFGRSYLQTLTLFWDWISLVFRWPLWANSIWLKWWLIVELEGSSSRNIISAIMRILLNVELFKPKWCRFSSHSFSQPLSSQICVTDSLIFNSFISRKIGGAPGLQFCHHVDLTDAFISFRK